MGGKTLHEPLYKNIFQMVFRLKCEENQTIKILEENLGGRAHKLAIEIFLINAEDIKTLKEIYHKVPGHYQKSSWQVVKRTFEKATGSKVESTPEVVHRETNP